MRVLITGASSGIGRDLEKDLQIIKTDIIALHILTKLYLNNMIKKIKEKY